jgi:perosamine synthetase
VAEPIPWFGPVVGDDESEAVRAVVATGYLNDGPVARGLEKGIADFLGVRHAVAVTSGTAAISLALMALGIDSEDEVIVPDLTFIATANAVRMAGAKVKLVDVDPERFTIDVAAAEAAIGPRTRAIVPVDVNGRAADYAALEAICQARGLALVCDAAEALGSRHQGQYLGTFGHAGCFSFSANKTVTSGQGGLIVTNDDVLHDRLRELKDQGRR